MPRKQDKIDEQPMITTSQDQQPKISLWRKIPILVITVLLIYVCLGAWLYPVWWYSFLFEGGFRYINNWLEGIESFLSNYIVFIISQFLTIWIILALSRTNVPEKLCNIPKSYWEQTISPRKIFLFFVILVSLTGITVYLTDSRTREEREIAERQAQLNKKLFASWNSEQHPSKKLPLSEPTKFIYLDKILLNRFMDKMNLI